MHASLDSVLQLVKENSSQPVGYYFGGFEDEPEAVQRALKSNPKMQFLFAHCAPAEELAKQFGKSNIRRIGLGYRFPFSKR